MEKDQEFLDYIAKAIADYPEEIKIDRKVDEMGVLLTLDAPKDMGKLIGRGGQTARALRLLLRMVGMKNGSRVNLKINEPEGGRPAPASAPASEESAPEEPVAASVDQAMEDLKGI